MGKGRGREESQSRDKCVGHDIKVSSCAYTQASSGRAKHTRYNGHSESINRMPRRWILFKRKRRRWTKKLPPCCSSTCINTKRKYLFNRPSENAVGRRRPNSPGVGQENRNIPCRAHHIWVFFFLFSLCHLLFSIHTHTVVVVVVAVVLRAVLRKCVPPI